MPNDQEQQQKRDPQMDRAREKIGKVMGRQRGASPEEQKALEAEAQKHGATLQHVEDPGLPVDIVREAMERDDWTCVVDGTRNNPLTVHHVRHMHEDGETLAGEGQKVTTAADLNTVCTVCHDALHNLQRERMQAEGNGEGDEGEHEHDDKGQDKSGDE